MLLSRRLSLHYSCRSRNNVRDFHALAVIEFESYIDRASINFRATDHRQLARSCDFDHNIIVINYAVIFLFASPTSFTPKKVF